MRRLQNRKKKLSSRLLFVVSSWFALFLILASGFLTFIIFKVATLDKFSYINRLDNGSAEVVVIEIKKDKTTKFLIPSDTELDSARNLGKYKLGSLWILGEKEGFGGRLVTETISKNYLIPIFNWRNGRDNSLTFFQEIRAKLTEKQNINYQATFVGKKLTDSILVNFVDNKISSNEVKVSIEDLTGNLKTAENVALILEILGAKITSNSRGYDKDLDCEIVGSDKYLTSAVANIFDCRIIVETNQNVDLKLRLGVKFGERF